MHARRTLSLLIALVVTLSLAPASSAPRARALTILYFNDIHGHLEPWKPDSSASRTVGGIARIAALVDRIRRENRRAGRATLVLEAGDVLQGTPMSAIFQGEPDFEAFNLMKLDAMAIGNHEFDFGIENLRARIRQARFPVLSANVFTAEGRPLSRSSVVLSPVPGLRVGVIGLTTAETPQTTFPTNVTGLTFDDPVATARHAVPVLEQQCDLVVALTHIGTGEDRRLAREVPGVDVVVGGHNHLKIDGPVREGETVIVQAQDNGRFLGRLDLTVDNGRVTSASGSLIPIEDGMAERADIAKLVGRYAGQLDAKLKVPVGRSSVLLDGERGNVRTRETTLGNFVADLVREAAHTDVAILNAGSLRATIGAGTVTFGDVLTALPFNNTLVAVKVPGRTIREALDHAAAQDPAELPGSFVQVSGLRFAIEDGKAVDVRVGGEPIDEAKLYSVALPDFLLLGGDGFTMFAPAAVDRVETGIVLNGLVVDWFRKGGVANPRIEGRIVRRR
jgi:5'-nucleotidase/UDP-sugar diphosphatase